MEIYIDFQVFFADKLIREQSKKLCVILKNEKINLVEYLSKDMEKYNLEGYYASEINSYYKGRKKEDQKG